MTSENRNSRKSQPDDWPIGKAHCAKRTLSTRNEERCNFSWISSGPARLLLSVSRSFPFHPLASQSFVPVLPSFPNFSLPALRSCSVFVSPTRGRTPRSQARSESSQSELKPASRCAGCILCIPLGSRPHPASHVGPCSTSCARVSFLRFSLSLPLSIYLSIYLSLSPLPFSPRSPCVSRRISFSLFHSRLFLLFRSALQSGFFHEDLRFPLRRIITGNRSPRCR